MTRVKLSWTGKKATTNHKRVGCFVACDNGSDDERTTTRRRDDEHGATPAATCMVSSRQPRTVGSGTGGPQETQKSNQPGEARTVWDSLPIQGRCRCYRSFITHPRSSTNYFQKHNNPNHALLSNNQPTNRADPFRVDYDSNVLPTPSPRPPPPSTNRYLP
jgi:hypothetical protein